MALSDLKLREERWMWRMATNQEKGAPMRSSVLAAPLLAGLLLVGSRGHAAGEDGGTSSEAAADRCEQTDSSSSKEPYLGPCVVGSVQRGKPPRFPASDPSAPVGYPFCESGRLTLPKKRSGREPKFSPEALAAGVGGLAIARCTLTHEGVVKDCRIIKSLPHMEQEILDVLHGSRYTPVLCDGKPIDASYVFALKLRLPGGDEAGTDSP